MNKKQFEKIIKSKKLENYLLNCCNKSIKFTKRSWEKSIPLWIAAYFKSKGVPAYLFDGNYDTIS